MNMAESEGGVPTFLSTHPDPGDRYNTVNQTASEWQSKLTETKNWKVNADSYLQMIDGIIYGEDPRQGYVEGSTFYHPELRFRFTYPAGWQYQNQPTQVNMAPQDGKALLVFTLAKQKSLQAAADSTIAQLGLTLQSQKSISVNGLPAIATVAQQVTKNQSTGTQTANMVLSYFIQMDKNFYVFHGVSTDADFPNYENSLESTMKSFARLTDASKINVKPNKITVKRVQRAGTLADAFTYYGVKQDMRDELALLNDMALTDKVQVGKLIKIVGQ